MHGKMNDEQLADAVVTAVAKCLLARKSGLTPMCDTCKQAFTGDTPEIVLVHALSHYGLLRTTLEIQIEQSTAGESGDDLPPFTLPFDKSHIN